MSLIILASCYCNHFRVLWFFSCILMDPNHFVYKVISDLKLHWSISRRSRNGRMLQFYNCFNCSFVNSKLDSIVLFWDFAGKKPRMNEEIFFLLLLVSWKMLLHAWIVRLHFWSQLSPKIWLENFSQKKLSTLKHKNAMPIHLTEQ